MLYCRTGDGSLAVVGLCTYLQLKVVSKASKVPLVQPTLPLQLQECSSPISRTFLPCSPNPFASPNPSAHLRVTPPTMILLSPAASTLAWTTRKSCAPPPTQGMPGGALEAPVATARLALPTLPDGAKPPLLPLQGPCHPQSPSSQPRFHVSATRPSPRTLNTLGMTAYPLSLSLSRPTSHLHPPAPTFPVHPIAQSILFIRLQSLPLGMCWDSEHTLYFRVS